MGQDQSQAQVPRRERLRQEGGEFVRPRFPSKKLEVDKTISKVSQPSSSGPSAKRSKYARDDSDLRSFLAKGTPARYGGGKFQRRQPYQPPAKFRSQKYYQPRSGRGRSVLDKAKTTKSTQEWPSLPSHHPPTYTTWASQYIQYPD